jgi:hypothetical protein
MPAYHMFLGRRTTVGKIKGKIITFIICLFVTERNLRYKYFYGNNLWRQVVQIRIVSCSYLYAYHVHIVSNRIYRIV